MTFALYDSIVRCLIFAGLALIFGACTESGGGSNDVTSANTVTVSGTVGETRIVAMNDNDHIVVEDDTAGRLPSAPGRFPFTLTNLPVGSNPRLFFISNDSLFPFYLGATNVVTFDSAGSIDLGFVTMDLGTGRSTPEFPPHNVTPKTENPNVPPGLIPGSSPAVSILSPVVGAPVPVGPVTIIFVVQNHSIGNPGTSHLHFYLDTDATAYHFYGGNGISDDNGVLYNGGHTHFVHWKSATSFDIFGLSSTAHTVRVVLADQNHNRTGERRVDEDAHLYRQPAADRRSATPVGALRAQLSCGIGLGSGRSRVLQRAVGGKDSNHQSPVAAGSDRVLSDFGCDERRAGLTRPHLDPAFAQNHFVYVYYTAPGATKNRVVQYTESTSSCTNETPILDGLPVSVNHNGWIIQF
ncbi:MAG: hypothetical protein ACREJN_07990, partial [Nitrospiraceae bacterium]